MSTTEPSNRPHRTVLHIVRAAADRRPALLTARLPPRRHSLRGLLKLPQRFLALRQSSPRSARAGMPARTERGLLAVLALPPPNLLRGSIPSTPEVVLPRGSEPIYSLGTPTRPRSPTSSGPRRSTRQPRRPRRSTRPRRHRPHSSRPPAARFCPWGFCSWGWGFCSCGPPATRSGRRRGWGGGGPARSGRACSNTDSETDVLR